MVVVLNLQLCFLMLVCSLACEVPPPAEPEVPDGGDPCCRQHDGDAPASPDAGSDAAVDELEPCGGRDSDTPGAAYDLCLWTAAGELESLLDDPEQRREIRATLTVAGERYDGAELELHGGSARLWPKKSYRIRFPAERPSYDFFGDGAERVERLVLQAAWIDPSFVRSKLVFDGLRELGALAPRVAHARVHINGKFEGLYQVIERVDEHFLERNGLSRHGNLYKAESHDANFGLHDDPLLGFSERSQRDGVAPDLGDLFRAVADTEPSLTAYRREIETRIHREDFELWNAVMSFALNLDTFTKNYYLYRDAQAEDAERGKVFRIIHWDADTTFGLWWNGERAEAPEAAPLYGEGNQLARRMFEIPAYRRDYVERLLSATQDTLSRHALESRAKALLSALEPDITDDLTLWQRETSFAAERMFLLDMIALRAEVMGELLARESAALGLGVP